MQAGEKTVASDDMDGQTRSQSEDARNTSKELLSSLVSEHQISYEAAEEILSGIKNETFRTEDVKFRVEDLLDGDLFEPDSPVKMVTDPRFSFLLGPDSGTARKERERHKLVGAFLKAIGSNRSEELLASFVEDGSLSVEGIQRILVAVRKGILKSKDLALENFNSIVFYPLQLRQEVLFKNARLSPSSSMPHVVLQELIDLLAECSFPFQITFDEDAAGILPKIYLRNPHTNASSTASTARSVLKCLALVHPSWTPMVYRALGKSLHAPLQLENRHRTPWTNLLQNPLYGTRTQELSFATATDMKKSDDVRRFVFMSNIPHRFPNLKTMSITIYRINEDIAKSMETLIGLQNLENLKVELGMFQDVPGLIDNVEKWTSFFDAIARFPRLRTFQIPYCSTGLQNCNIPPELAALTANRMFQKLQLCILFPDHPFKGTNPEGYPTQAVWTRQGDDAEGAFGLTSLPVRCLPNSFRSFSDLNKRSLTFLHAICTEELSWNPVDHDLKSFVSLRKVEVISEMPFIEEILSSLPRAVESLSLAFPRTLNFSDVDKVMESYITSDRSLNLKHLQVARSYFKDKLYTYRKLKIPSSMPLTSAVCQERGIEHIAWH